MLVQLGRLYSVGLSDFGSIWEYVAVLMSLAGLQEVE